MPIDAMREQLRYWRAECETAEQKGDAERITQCRRYIAQCEMVITALEQAAPYVDAAERRAGTLAAGEG